MKRKYSLCVISVAEHGISGVYGFNASEYFTPSEIVLIIRAFIAGHEQGRKKHFPKPF